MRVLQRVPRYGEWPRGGTVASVWIVPRTGLTNLLNLAPPVQQALLLGDLHLSERRLRALVAGVEWERQGAAD